MNKKIIAIASILKPLHDPRHYERFALSLAKANKYAVNIIANGEKKPNTEQIKFYSNGLYKRKILNRISIQCRTIRRIMSLRPDLLIICTVELLPFVIVYHQFHPCRIIYDIQENYHHNLKYQSEYGWFSKYMISRIIRWIENISPRFIDHFILAEKCYSTQLSFVQEKPTILENKTVILKYSSSNQKQASHKRLKLLFSGTISYYSGVSRIMELVGQLEAGKIDFEMVIIGQVINREIRNMLESLPSENVRLLIDTKPIPHIQIMDEITKADLGIIAYYPNPVNEEKIPTKQYEYTAYQLPYLVQKDTQWATLGKELGGAIPVDFESIPIKNLEESVQTAAQSFKKAKYQNASWETEEPRFIKLIEALLQ